MSDAIIVWDGRRDGPSRGLLCVVPETLRAAPPLPRHRAIVARPGPATLIGPGQAITVGRLWRVLTDEWQPIRALSRASGLHRRTVVRIAAILGAQVAWRHEEARAGLAHGRIWLRRA